MSALHSRLEDFNQNGTEKPESQKLQRGHNSSGDDAANGDLSNDLGDDETWIQVPSKGRRGRLTTQNHGDKEAWVTESVHVFYDSIRKIIGIRGGKIKEIQETTGVKDISSPNYEQDSRPLPHEEIEVSLEGPEVCMKKKPKLVFVISSLKTNIENL